MDLFLYKQEEVSLLSRVCILLVLCPGIWNSAWLHLLSPADCTSLVDTHWETPCLSVTFCTRFRQQGNVWFCPNQELRLIQCSGLWLGNPKGSCTLETIKGQMSKYVRREFQKRLGTFTSALKSVPAGGFTDSHSGANLNPRTEMGECY